MVYFFLKIIIDYLKGCFINSMPANQGQFFLFHPEKFSPDFHLRHTKRI